MNNREETLKQAIDRGYKYFWEHRGMTRQLCSQFEPYEIRNGNPYNAFGERPSELNPKDLIARAKSRKDRLVKSRKAEENRGRKEAEKNAIQG